MYQSRIFVGNVKKYYQVQKSQFPSTYAQKLVLEKDRKNKRAAGMVAAEEIGRAILRGRKRMAEQSANSLQAHEEILRTTSSSSSHYKSCATLSPPASRFPNPNKDTNNDIDRVKDAIKEEAKSIHSLFVEGAGLEPHLFKRMSIGLSSILDFCDRDQGSQKTIFEQTWASLYEHFNHFCLKNNSTTKAKDYLKKMIDAECKNKGLSSENLRILNVFDFMLDLYDENAWIFDENQKKSEIDLLSVVWNPLFRKMTYIHNNIILMKGSVFSSGIPSSFAILFVNPVSLEESVPTPTPSS